MRETGIAMIATSLLLGGVALGQQPSIGTSLGLFVYPSGGQDAAKQGTDEQECYAWAQQTTGMDPRNPPSAQQAATAPQQDTAQAGAAGAVRGGLTGALLANATDNKWETAAAAGMVIGARRGATGARRRNEQAQQEAVAEQQQASQQEVQQFRNAFSACIEGRDYTVK